MPITTFDIWDQAQLTHNVKRSLTTAKENVPSLAAQIAPIVDVQSRKVKFRVSEVDAFGIGQLRAPDGNPKLYRSAITYRDEYIELGLPDEMERISEDVMLRLQSTDPNIAASGGVDVITRGRILALRNQRRIEKMRWDAILTGKVTLDYEDSDYQIDFGIPATHIVTAGTLWTTLSADIIGQIRGWQKVVADDIGQYATKIHMNSNTWDYVYNNTTIASKLSTWGRGLMVPQLEEVASLFRQGSEIIIHDGGYRAEGVKLGADSTKPNSSKGDSNLTKWLPDGKVLLTTDYTLDGEPIADTPNGQVMIATGYNTAEARQGPQAETLLDPFSKNTFLRYASAAVPRIRIPEAFLIATVY